MFNLFLPQTPLRTWRLGEIYLFFLSQRRRGRKELRCLICCYPNTAACSAFLRDYVCFFSLAKARRAPRTSLFVLFLPQTPLRALRLGEIYCFFSRRGAKYAKVCFCYYPLRALRLCESKFFFWLTGVGFGCCAMLSTGSDKSYDAAIFLAKVQTAEVYFCCCPLRAWRLGESKFFSRLLSDPAVTPVLLLTEITKIDFAANNAKDAKNLLQESSCIY